MAVFATAVRYNNCYAYFHENVKLRTGTRYNSHVSQAANAYVHNITRAAAAASAPVRAEGEHEEGGEGEEANDGEHHGEVEQDSVWAQVELRREVVRGPRERLDQRGLAAVGLRDGGSVEPVQTPTERVPV